MSRTGRHSARASTGPTGGERRRRRRSGHRVRRRPGRRRSLLGPSPASADPARRLEPDRAGGGRGGGHRDPAAVAAAVVASRVAGQRDGRGAADRRGGTGQCRLLAQPGLGVRGPGRDRRRARGGRAAAGRGHAAGADRAEDRGLPGRGHRLRRPDPAHHLAAGRRQGQLRPGQDGAGQARASTHATPRGTFQVAWKAGPSLVSNIYHEPMPWATFFAPGGIAFHGGSLTAVVARLRPPDRSPTPTTTTSTSRSAPRSSSSNDRPLRRSDAVIGMRRWSAHSASWSAKCGLAGSPDAPPGITKLADAAVGEVHHLPVHRQGWSTVNGPPGRQP